MDKEKAKKAGPAIAAAVMIAILALWLAPKLFVKKAGVQASGTVEIREADIASRISSRVIALKKDEGQTVKKGEILAVLDGSIASAQRDAAQAVFNNAQETYNRMNNLLSTQSISQQQFDAAKMSYISSAAQLKQADVMAGEAEVKAPWDGMILKKYAEEGELVSANSPIFTIGDLSVAKVTIYVPLVEMTALQYGMKALVSIDAYKERKFEGKITYISGAAEFTPKNVQTKDERIKEVFEVRITVPNPDGTLKPGIPADVEIQN
jgi:HlyD family secretion protein